MKYPKEILHEYVFQLEGMSEPVKARVMRDLDPDGRAGEYSWDISHFCKDASANRHAATVEEAQDQLRKYASSLTAEKIFAKNICY
jgi:hypothetical protein